MELINQEAIKQIIVEAVKDGKIQFHLPVDKIQGIVTKKLDEHMISFKAETDAILVKAKALTSATQEVKIIAPDTTKIEKGLFHKDFKKVFALVAARSPSSNYPVGLWLHGAPGSGKTHMAEQIAKILGVKFHPIYGGPTMTETKLLGYRNAGTGAYQLGLIYDWYKNGGLLAIDEADLGESLVCMNSALANSVYRFPDGEVITRHPDTYFIALANTNGLGAKQGFRRQVQDAAALDRFSFMEFHYDENLEKALAGNFPEFAEYVQKVRNWVKTSSESTNLHVTPRATMKGVALLANCPDLSDEDIVMMSIYGLFSKDAYTACNKAVGTFKRKGAKGEVSQPIPTTYAAPGTSPFIIYPAYYPGANKVAAIKVVRGVTGMGLKEAKDWIETADSKFQLNATPQQAIEYAKIISDQSGKTGSGDPALGHGIGHTYNGASHGGAIRHP